MEPPNKRRRKRASPEDLYRSCKLGGDCKPDVQNKYEQNTLADRLLKWLGSIIYLGGLGIGTGKGTGGPSGYRPLQPGSAAGAIPETIPIRPSVPIDPLPAEAVPGLIGPEAPSIVPVSEVIPEYGVAIEGGTALGPSTEVTVIEEILNPSFDNSGIGAHPTVISGEESDVAILNVSPNPPPRRIAIQVDVHQPPDVSVVASTHADAAAVFVDPSLSGDTIGFEEIELNTLPSRSDFTLEEQGARTSTPIDGLRSAVRGARNLYYRLTRQQQTFNPDFLGDVRRAVQFSFDNAAFEADVSLQFEQDLDALAAAPDPDFRDVRELHRLQLNATPQGTVRASRLGRRGFFSTRSGTVVGENVHYFYDISPIRPESEPGTVASDNLNVPSIPLEVLGTSSGMENADIIVNISAESSFVDLPSTNESEEALLDPMSENFDNSHLLLTYQTDDNETLVLPTFPASSPKIFVGDSTRGLFVHFPVHDTTVPTLQNGLVPLYTPTSTVYYFSDSTFYLDPYLQRRRKRKYLDAF